MKLRNDLIQSVPDAISSPVLVKTAATATTGVGVSVALDWFEWLERGVGMAAAILGILVTIALWRKLKTERELAIEESELRIKERRLRITALENRLNTNKQGDIGEDKQDAED